MAGLASQEYLKLKVASQDDGGGFVDPAEFIFTNTKFHDCFLTATDPETKNVEKIGVASFHLISQSSVFRKILLNDKSGLKHIEVNEVSPAVAKLMLTYIYGGKMPTMDRSTRAQLALAARIYDLRYLEDECCRVLMPTTVNEVFPALICAAHLDNTSLLPEVKKIIQGRTDEVIKHSDFFKLDSKCMEFIASQETLAIKEVELWKALVNWATTNAGKDGNKTTRDVLSTTLQFVRLASLTHEQIMEEVVPTKILSDSEVVQLLSAVFTKKALDCPGLSGNTELRSALPESLEKPVLHSLVERLNLKSHPILDKTSKLTLMPLKPIELESFVIRSTPKILSTLSNKNVHSKISKSYIIFYDIVVTEHDRFDTVVGSAENVSAIVHYDEDITLNFELKDDYGDDLVLREGCTYWIDLSFTQNHPSYLVVNQLYESADGLGLALDDVRCHVKALTYRVLHY